MQWKIKGVAFPFYHDWQRNVKQELNSNVAYSILCTTSKQVDFCIERLKEHEPNAAVDTFEVERSIRMGRVLYVRWAFASDLSFIVVCQYKVGHIDNTMAFDEVFEVVWDSDLPPANPISTKEASHKVVSSSRYEDCVREITSDRTARKLAEAEVEINIIHSKIKYNVIQTES
jgi:hypothetical protein